MRMVFVYLILALIAGAGVVNLIETEPGYLLLSYANYTVETSLWVGLLIIALFAGLCYALLHLLRRVLGSPKSLANWAGGRRNRSSLRMTQRGLISFIEGNWARSRRQLLRGSKDSETPLLNYLMAARASHQLGENDKALEYLAQAEGVKADAGIAVALTQAELDLAAERYEQAVATLERARRSAKQHPYVLSLLKKAYVGLRDWDALAALLPELKKHELETDTELRNLERSIYLHRLFDCKLLENDSKPLQAVWNQVPATLKKDEQLISTYVRLLVEAGSIDVAEKAIARFLKTEWGHPLVAQYGYLPSDNPKAMLSQAEGWLSRHQDDAGLMLTLGRLSARNELWGKARDYFEQSYKLDRSPEVCAELGRLLVHLGEEQHAAAYYREGLGLAQPALPPLPMPALPSATTVDREAVD